MRLKTRHYGKLQIKRWNLVLEIVSYFEPGDIGALRKKEQLTFYKYTVLPNSHFFT
jgi:hypothetical protein